MPKKPKPCGAAPYAGARTSRHDGAAGSCRRAALCGFFAVGATVASAGAAATDAASGVAAAALDWDASIFRPSSAVVADPAGSAAEGGGATRPIVTPAIAGRLVGTRTMRGLRALPETHL